MLSLFRIAMSPVVALFMLQEDIIYRIFSFFLILLVSLTDALDGYYARKYNLISKIGKYLDPFADKIFVLSIFFTLYYLLNPHIPLWMIIVIFSRDLFVTLLRNIFEVKKLEFSTSKLGKNKTLLQIIVIHFIVLLMIIKEYNIYPVD